MGGVHCPNFRLPISEHASWTLHSILLIRSIRQFSVKVRFLHSYNSLLRSNRTDKFRHHTLPKVEQRNRGRPSGLKTPPCYFLFCSCALSIHSFRSPIQKANELRVCGMQSGQMAMKVSQNALYLMIGIVLVINEFKDSFLPIMTFSLTATLFVFNIIYVIVVTK